MKLSFVVLNYRAPHHLRICCEYLAKLELPFSYEIIVVDNASHDESLELVQSVQNAYPEAPITIIANPENGGHAKGNNVGIRQATGEYVMIINPDIMLKDAADIVRMVSYMDGHQQTAILGPKLHNPDATIQFSCYRKYSLLTPAYRRSFLGKLPWAKRDIARHLMTDFDHNEIRSVDWVLGACMLIRASVIKEIGGFYENFFLYFADYELCDRARQAGYDVIYLPDTQHVIHYHQRQSVTSRFSVLQAVSYLTRRHLMDWWVYLKKSNVNKQHDKPSSKS